MHVEAGHEVPQRQLPSPQPLVRMPQAAHLSGEPGAESAPARSPEEVPSEGASLSPSAPSGRHTTSTAPVQAGAPTQAVDCYLWASVVPGQ